MELNSLPCPTLADCVEAIARDPQTGPRPAVTEAIGQKKTLTYQELDRLVHIIAGNLSKCLGQRSDVSQPVCLLMHRSVDWYALFLACTRVGVPVVAASRDHPDKSQEIARLKEIVELLNPAYIISDFPVGEALPSVIGNICVIRAAELVTDHGFPSPTHSHSNPIMAFHFTGGTTSASKCVMITHQMAVHEVSAYPSITKVRPRKVLQNASSFWPASAFGQIDIAIGFKACLVLSVEGGASADEVERLVKTHKIDSIGVVPSVLRSLQSNELSLVFTWGESLPREVARSWASKVTLIDLLIATEYWLSLYAVISHEEWSYTVHPSVRTHFEPTAEDGVSTLFLGGNMVTPGYVSKDTHSDRFKTVDGVKLFCTNDCVRCTVSVDGTTRIQYAGRADNLVKIGGKFVDLNVVAQKIIEKVGRGSVKEFVVVKDSLNTLHACFALKRVTNMSILVQAVQNFLPSVKPGCVHVINEIPRNSVTGKVDSKKLIDSVASPVLSPQYRLPDSEVKAGKLLGVPNPHRWVWLVVVLVLLGTDIRVITGAVALMLKVMISAALNLPSVWKILALPFTTHGLSVITKKNRILNKLVFEVPGDTPFAAVGILVTADFVLLKPIALAVTATGLVLIAMRKKTLDFFAMIKCVLAYAFLFYMSLPWDLAWAWKDWWKNVESYWDLIPYYKKRLNQTFSRFAWYKKIRENTCWCNSKITHAFDQYDLVGYPETPAFTKMTYFQYPSDEKKFPCDACGASTKQSLGAFDRYKKFGTNREKWFCENCWWSEVVDEVSSQRYQRIGQWMYGRRLSELSPKPSVCEEGSTREGSEESETESPRESIDEIEVELSSMCSTRREIARMCIESLEIVGCDRALIRSAGLTSLSSLVKVSIHEQLKTRLPSIGNISAVALFGDVYSFSKLVDKVSAVSESPDEPKKKLADGAGDYIINNCGPGLWTVGACDWILKYRSDEPLVDPECMLSDIVRALMKRHPVFRAKPIDDLRISDFLQQAIALTPAKLRGISLLAAKQLWPRIRVEPFREDNILPLKFVEVEGNMSKSRIMSFVDSQRAQNFVPPVEFVVYFSANSKAVQTVYFYVRISHLFADGFAVNTIAADLEALLSRKKPIDFGKIEVMNGLEILQKRHHSALSRSATLYSANLCSSTEELWRDDMLVKVMWLHRRPVQSLIACSTQLGVPIEILLMGVVMASLAEKLGWARMPLSLMHAMRDGVNENQMIGYFSDYKDMGFFNTDGCYVELFHQLASRIRSRDWRQYDQSLLYDHSYGRHAWDKSLFPISINLLSHVRAPTGSRIENVETYWRASNRNGLRDCRLIHVYLEETRLESEWAIRMHFNRRLFDCSWVVDYVCRSLDKTLRNVLSDPCQPIKKSTLCNETRNSFR